MKASADPEPLKIDIVAVLSLVLHCTASPPGATFNAKGALGQTDGLAAERF